MNIENHFLEKSCSNLTSLFSKYFAWDDIDLSITRVDLSNKQVSIMSNNYEWLLIYWNADLDLRLSERLSPGIQYWSNYSEQFINTLKKTKKRELKIDFCAKYGNVYEITSINSRNKISLNEMISLYKYRPTIIDFASGSWKKDKDNYSILPLREDIKIPVSIGDEMSEQELEPLDIHPYMCFGNMRFTRKEMMTIRLLLSHCRVKEISYIQGCSEATENKRIQRIKEKLGCAYTSPSGLFKALKENGITLACLESLVSYS